MSSNNRSHFVVSKVLNGKRITLPVEWCKRNGLKVGDVVIIEETTRGFEIIPAEVTPKQNDGDLK